MTFIRIKKIVRRRVKQLAKTGAVRTPLVATGTNETKPGLIYAGKGVIQVEKTEMLMVIGADSFTMKDKTTGKELHKFKYLFLNSENQIVKGFSEREIFRFTEAVTSKGTYDRALAVAVKFVGRVWDDVLKWKLDPDQ